MLTVLCVLLFLHQPFTVYTSLARTTVQPALYSIHAHQKHVHNMDDTQPGMASKHSDKLDTCLPIFFKQQDIEDGEGGRSITCYDVCMAVSAVTGKDSIEGAQNVRGIWRIYLRNRTARLQLCVKKNQNQRDSCLIV